MKLQKFLLWLGTSLFLLDGSEIALSQNNFWQQTNGPYGGLILSLAINARGDVFAGTFHHGIFRSTDNGKSWTSANSGLADPYVYCLSINTRGYIFAGTSANGVFRSTDNGSSLIPVDADLKYNLIPYRCMAINKHGYIFAGTDGEGVLRSVLPTTAVKESTDDTPTAFSLQQNYPNPFNPVTTIQFSMPRESYVRLKVYNFYGQEVAALVDQHVAAGTYKVNWDASRLASGFYLYRLEAEGFAQTKKLLLMK